MSVMQEEEQSVRLRLRPALCVLPVTVIIPDVINYLQVRLRPHHYPYGHADGRQLLIYFAIIAVAAILLNRGISVTLTPTVVRRFDRDFHRIGQWWLAHRGPDWRPIPPELRVPPGGKS